MLRISDEIEKRNIKIEARRILIVLKESGGFLDRRMARARGCGDWGPGRRLRRG